MSTAAAAATEVPTLLPWVLDQWDSVNADVGFRDVSKGTSLRYLAAVMLRRCTGCTAPTAKRAHGVFLDSVSPGLALAAARLLSDASASNDEAAGITHRLQLVQPPSAQLLRTLADGVNSQLLLPVHVDVQSAWLQQRDRYFHAVHDAAESIILRAGDEAAVTEHVGGVKRIGVLRAILERFNLVPTENDESGGAGIAFCMLPLVNRSTVLLRAALDTAVSAGNSPATALSVVASLGFASTSQCFGFPSADAGTARHIFVRLSEVGFLYPLKLGDQRLFLIHPALRDTLLAVPKTAKTTAQVDQSFAPFADAYQQHEAALPTRKRHERPDGLAERAARRGHQHASGAEALAKLGRSTDINARIDSMSAVPSATRGPMHAVVPTDCVVTETNFRLYVYLAAGDNAGAPAPLTPHGIELNLPHASRTLLRILDQFASRELLVPRLAVYRLTRAKFLEAARRGVTQQQILAFLSERAHPSAQFARQEGEAASHNESSSTGSFLGATSASDACLPQSVADQLALWEREAQRVHVTYDAVLLQAPNSIAASKMTELFEESDRWRGGKAVIARSGLNMAVVREAYADVLAPKMAH